MVDINKMTTYLTIVNRAVKNILYIYTIYTIYNIYDGNFQIISYMVVGPI